MLKRCLVLFVWLAVVCSLSARPWIALFGSRDCEDCAKLKADWSRKYREGDSPVMVFINIDVKANYRFLNMVEDELETVAKGNTFPVVLMGREMACGREGFDALEARMPELIRQIPTGNLFSGIETAAASAEAPIVEYTYVRKKNANAGKHPSVPEQSDPAAESGRGQPQQPPALLFFRQPGCRKCERQSREFDLLRDLVPSVAITEYDVTTLKGQAMLTRARKAFGMAESSENLAPMVAWASGFVTGRMATADELAEALKAEQMTPFWTAPLTQAELDGEKSHLEAIIGASTWGAVLLGGLTDGINPCAFATSVFLISYLLYLKRRRRQILLVGAGFCAGVFLTYFLYGLALSLLLRQLQSIHWLKMTVYGLFGLSGLVLCVLHLRDAMTYRRTGKASDMDMGLSKETHRGIHDKIRRLTDVAPWLMMPAAFILGAIVSSMELACTGQVYFPVLAALAESGINQQFVIRLLLYNVCFILPLAVITVLAAYGVGAKALGSWAKEHVFATKILMAVLFALLGGLMLVMAFAK